MPKTKLTNFHSHNPNAPIRNMTLSEYDTFLQELESADYDGMFTVGIHPWETADDQIDGFESLAAALVDDRVIALGEVGIDPMHGASVDRQLEILQLQLRHATAAGLPVVFHIVRRYDLLVELYNEFKPSAPWAVHGFRAKPEVVRQLASLGIYISLGKRFNAESAAEIPDNLLLVETDEEPESELPAIIEAVAEARDQSVAYVTSLAAKNLARFYGF